MTQREEVARPAGPTGSIRAASAGSTERSIKVKVKMRIKRLRQKFLALAAGIGITFSLTAVVAPPASASDTAPCSGYCTVYNNTFSPDYLLYLWDSNNILLDEETSSIPFAFLNERTWDGRDVYEMYERTTAKCITWSGSETDNIFRLTSCTPGSADQEFFYNANEYLVNVGATGYFGPFYCMIAKPPTDGPYAGQCSTSPTNWEIWNLEES
jgi:hypothetical protein